MVGNAAKYHPGHDAFNRRVALQYRRRSIERSKQAELAAVDDLLATVACRNPTPQHQTRLGLSSFPGYFSVASSSSLHLLVSVLFRTQRCLLLKTVSI